VHIIKLFILIACLFISAQAKELHLNEEEKAFLLEHPLIRIQNERSWAPLDFRENGRAKGYNVDYMKLLATKAGFKIKFYPGHSWSIYLQMLDKKKLDLISGMKITPQRTNYSLFSDDPVIELYNGILQNKDTYYNALDDLKNKRVAVVEGYYQEEIFRLHYPSITLVMAKDTMSAMKLVVDKKADATIQFHSVLQYNIRRYIFTDLHSIPLVQNEYFDITVQHIAIRKDWPIFKSIIDKTMQSLSQKDLHQLRDKWLTTLQDRHIKLSKDELNYLKTKKTISYCTDPDWLPVEKIENNKHIGISADYLQKISSNLGINFKLVPTETWNQSLEEFKSKHCDFLSSVIQTKDREKYMNFSSSFINMSLVITTKSDTFFINSLQNIKSKTIAIVDNYAYKLILKKDHPKVKIVYVSNVYEGLKKVQDEEVYAYVDTLEATSEQLRTNSFSDLKISGKIQEEVSLSFGVYKGAYVLFDILEKGLATLSNEDKKEVYDDWVYVTIDQTDYSLVWKSIAALILIGLFFSYRYKLTINYNAKLLDINKELEKLNDQLEELSHTDQLTQIANRRHLDSTLVHEIKRAIRHKTTLCLVIIDIDFFKKVNDSYGHPKGDKVLIEIAQILKENCREIDTVGRWGGEEFLLISSQISINDAKTMCEKLRLKVKSHDFGLNDQLTISLGVSHFDIENDSEASFLSRVDANLYKAKDTGRDKVVSS